VLLVASLVLFGGAGTESRGQEPKTNPAAAEAPAAPYSRRNAFTEAVRKTRAGVVAIRVEKRSRNGRGTESAGTGIIVDDRGYCITNRHVVANAVAIQVQLFDGTVLDAQLVTVDTTCDLAILRVRSTQALQPLRLGPAHDLMVGEDVIAVGHPFGYQYTVSRGIISALGRSVKMEGCDDLTNLIQTDASINPGNSGGPLLNINGEVIGVNAALRDGAHGIAFAINAETVKQSLARHLSAAKIAGVGHGMLCRENAEEHVVVEGVPERTPAAAAGLRPGDEILRVAERPVANRFDVERALWDRRPGEQVSLTVLRQGKSLVIPLTLSQEREARR
jgi:serine protease Do